MTDDEVQLIYDYLHENYEYRDGELIRKNKCNRSGKKTGHSIGSFFYSNKNPSMRCGLTINGKKIYKPLSHLIFLFHKKRFSECVDFYDENPTNCKIENIYECTFSKMQNKKEVLKGYEEILTSTGIRYRVSITTQKNKVRGKIHLGSYAEKEMAIKIYKSAKTFYMQGIDEVEIKIRLKEIYPNIRIKGYKNKNLLAGVHPSGDRFKSSVMINKKVIYLGSFDTPEEAHAAYLKAKEEYKSS